MIYVVIQGFHDLTDAIRTKSGPVYHAYKPGDTYPRDGLQPPEERILELCGRRNRQGRPLIAPLCGIGTESREGVEEQDGTPGRHAEPTGRTLQKAAAGQAKERKTGENGAMKGRGKAGADEKKTAKDAATSKAMAKSKETAKPKAKGRQAAGKGMKT